jgi:hypothetical protein
VVLQEDILLLQEKHFQSAAAREQFLQSKVMSQQFLIGYNSKIPTLSTVANLYKWLLLVEA